MKIGPKYKLPFKRRLKKKTDYDTRYKLLLSKKHRLVIRKSLKHMKAQIIEFTSKSDRVLVSATSQELQKFGWKASNSNIPAAYLVGLLIGKRAIKKRIKSVIFDMGLQRTTKGSRLFAVLKGALDAGLEIPHSPEIFPIDEKIKGMHIANYGKVLKNNKERLKRQFSKVKPEEVPRMFEEVRSKIMKG